MRQFRKSVRLPSTTRHAASGCEVSYLTDEEIAALDEVMQPVHEEYRDVIGSELLDKTYEIIDSFAK